MYSDNKDVTALLLEKSEVLSSTGSWIWDVNTGHVIWSDNMCRLYGLEPSEFEGTLEFALTFMHPDDVPAINESMRILIEERRPHSFQYRIVRKDGETRWLSGSQEVITDEDDEISRIVGAVYDITERKHAESELQAEKDRYYNLVTHLDSGVVVHAADTSIEYCNQRSGELLGLSADQMMGKTAMDLEWMFINEDETRMALEDYPVNRIINTRRPIKNVVVGIISKKLKGTNWLVCNGSPIFNDSGCIDQIIISFHNITALKNAQLSVAEAEYKQRTLISNISDVIAIIDQNGIIRYKSPNIERFFGWDKDELNGKEAWTTVHPEDLERMQGVFFELLKEVGSVANTEFRYVCKDGSFKWVEMTARNLIHDQTINGILLNYRDITDKKNARDREEALRLKLARSERMESLGLLAGGVAHDLNNVLGPLVVLSEVMKEDIADLELADTELGRDMVSSLDIMHTSAQRAAKVVKDLVGLSRRGRYELNPVDITALPCFSGSCETINRIKNERPDIEVITSTADKGVLVMGSEDQLIRIAQNLLLNASQAIEGKGTITVSTAVKALEVEYMGYEPVPAGEYAVLSISDTGSGIKKDDLTSIFEPFFTRKKKNERSGSGLGLSIVHGILRDHHGYIDVESELGAGTCFTIYLPLLQESELQHAEDIDDDLVGGTESILVVDDEPGQRFLARRSLRKLGYTVTEAESGYEALEIFEEISSKPEPAGFDLVVLDMIMGDDLDGLDTLKSILKLFPDQRVIIASGHAEDDRASEARQLGAGWLAKPYEIREIANSVRARLDS